MKPMRLLMTASALAWGGGLAQAQSPATTTPPSDQRYTEDGRPSAEIDAQRQAIWESKEMIAAREWLVDHMARSAQISPSQSKRYIEELKRLSPEQMKLWLLTFEEQQAERTRQRATFDAARQLSIDNAMRSNQATQQAANNINQTRTAAARTAQESINNQQRATQERSRQLVSDRDAAARAALEPSSYIWLNTVPWGPFAGYPVNGGANIDPAAFQGVLGVTRRAPGNTITPGARRDPPPNR